MMNVSVAFTKVSKKSPRDKVRITSSRDISPIPGVAVSLWVDDHDGDTTVLHLGERDVGLLIDTLKAAID
jgi:hypothetical protein